MFKLLKPTPMKTNLHCLFRRFCKDAKPETTLVSTPLTKPKIYSQDDVYAEGFDLFEPYDEKTCKILDDDKFHKPNWFLYADSCSRVVRMGRYGHGCLSTYCDASTATHPELKYPGESYAATVQRTRYGFVRKLVLSYVGNCTPLVAELHGLYLGISGHHPKEAATVYSDNIVAVRLINEEITLDEYHEEYGELDFTEVKKIVEMSQERLQYREARMKIIFVHRVQNVFADALVERAKCLDKSIAHHYDKVPDDWHDIKQIERHDRKSKWWFQPLS